MPTPSTEKVNNLKPVEDRDEGERALRALLKASNPKNIDFGITSMFCGSGRKPGDGTDATQHWEMKPFNDNQLTFRYKDTLVTFNPETGNVECVTYGPGQGRIKLPAAVGAGLGINPTIEEMRTEQGEILQMISKIRKEMHAVNPAIKVLPEATIIGFSRGAAAVQQASRMFVPEPLPIVPATLPDRNKLDDRIEITQDKTTGNLHYKVFLQGKETSSGAINQEELKACGCLVDLKKPLESQEIEGFSPKVLQKQINRILLSRGEAGAGERALLDVEDSLWVSLDAVAGRKDAGEDHSVNPECNGIYVMSTKIETEFAMLKAFGATNPHLVEGENNWDLLTMNGKHGVVFDDDELRACIVANAGRDKPLAERKATIIEAVRPANSHALFQSVIGDAAPEQELTRNNYEEGMAFLMRNGAVDFLQLVRRKIGEIESPGMGNEFLDNWFKWGRGKVREEGRIQALQVLDSQVVTFLTEENSKRAEKGLPSLEELIDTKDRIAMQLKKLQDFIEQRKDCDGSPVAMQQRQIAIELLVSLQEIANQITPESTGQDLIDSLQAIRAKIKEVQITKQEILEANPETRTENKPGYTQLGTRLGVWGTIQVSKEPFDAKELMTKLNSMDGVLKLRSRHMNFDTDEDLFEMTEVDVLPDPYVPLSSTERMFAAGIQGNNLKTPVSSEQKKITEAKPSADDAPVNTPAAEPEKLEETEEEKVEEPRGKLQI